MSPNDFVIQIYPNPTDGLFTIAVITQIPGEIVMKIYDDTGARVLTQTKDLQLGRTLIPMDMRRWRDGMYYLELLKGTVRKNTARFMIMRRQGG